VFSVWTGGAITTTAASTGTIPVTNDITVGAVFLDTTAPTTHTITYGGITGDGTISITLNGITYQFTSAVVVSETDVISFTAIGNAGYTFSSWIGLSTSDNPTGDIYATGNMNVGAVFTDALDPAAPPILPIYGVIILVMSIILLTGYLWWLPMFNSNMSNVTKVHGKGRIHGSNRARNNTEYRFTTSEKGDVRFRVGDSSEWRSLESDNLGEYVIPKEDVTGHLTIEIK